MLPTGRSNLWFMILLDAMEYYGHENYILSGSYYPVQENLYLFCVVDAQFQSGPVQTGPSMALCNTPEAVYLLERSWKILQQQCLVGGMRASLQTLPPHAQSGNLLVVQSKKHLLCVFSCPFPCAMMDSGLDFFASYIYVYTFKARDDKFLRFFSL